MPDYRSINYNTLQEYEWFNRLWSAQETQIEAWHDVLHVKGRLLGLAHAIKIGLKAAPRHQCRLQPRLQMTRRGNSDHPIA